MCKNAETDALMGRELIAVAMDRNFSRFGGIFRVEVRDAASGGLGLLCGSRRAQASDNDYALIAARRGWTPMMFMTRVRL